MIEELKKEYKKDHNLDIKLYADYDEKLSDPDIETIITANYPMEKFYEIVDDYYLDTIQENEMTIKREEIIPFLEKNGINEDDERFEEMVEEILSDYNIYPDYDYLLNIEIPRFYIKIFATGNHNAFKQICKLFKINYKKFKAYKKYKNKKNLQINEEFEKIINMANNYNKNNYNKSFKETTYIVNEVEHMTLDKYINAYNNKLKIKNIAILNETDYENMNEIHNDERICIEDKNIYVDLKDKNISYIFEEIY